MTDELIECRLEFEKWYLDNEYNHSVCYKERCYNAWLAGKKSRTPARDGREVDYVSEPLKDCANKEIEMGKKLDDIITILSTSTAAEHYQCKICGGNPTSFPYKPDEKIHSPNRGGKKTTLPTAECGVDIDKTTMDIIKEYQMLALYSPAVEYVVKECAKAWGLKPKGDGK